MNITRRELYNLREAAGPWIICRADGHMSRNEGKPFTNPCKSNDALCDENITISIPRHMMQHIPKRFHL